jgi:hypothetical protein
MLNSRHKSFPQKKNDTHDSNQSSKSPLSQLDPKLASFQKTIYWETPSKSDHNVQWIKDALDLAVILAYFRLHKFASTIQREKKNQTPKPLRIIASKIENLT